MQTESGRPHTAAFVLHAHIPLIRQNHVPARDKSLELKPGYAESQMQDAVQENQCRCTPDELHSGCMWSSASVRHDMQLAACEIGANLDTFLH